MIFTKNLKANKECIKRVCMYDIIFFYKLEKYLLLFYKAKYIM